MLLNESIEGRLTIRAYDDLVWSIHSDDPAVGAIRSRIWTAYDDLTNSKKDMRSLPPETVTVIRRCISFLRSERRYLWPRKNFISGIALFRWFPPISRRLREEREAGDWEVWPFFTRQDLP